VGLRKWWGDGGKEGTNFSKVDIVTCYGFFRFIFNPRYAQNEIETKIADFYKIKGLKLYFSQYIIHNVYIKIQRWPQCRLDCTLQYVEH
jgi:hypothetical protein